MNTRQIKGNLYLIPTVIAPETVHKVITPQVFDVINHLDYFLVENVRTARRFLSELNSSIQEVRLRKPIEEIKFVEVAKDTAVRDVVESLSPVLKGKDAGILSEAGCPGVADPGAVAVKYAHQHGIKVIPLVGPSSILLALMASGFSGQSFTFHGYLPIENKARVDSLKKLEKEAQKSHQTQIFMETPYRNEKLFRDILQNCREDTLLCVAKDITGANEAIVTKTVREWKGEKVSLHKVPAIFLMFSS